MEVPVAAAEAEALAAGKKIYDYLMQNMLKYEKQEGNMSARQIIDEVNKVVVGKENEVSKIMMALLSRGHILLEDMPGVGKTTLANAFAKALGLEWRRIQFTPDVLPSDIVGFNAIDQNSGNFVLHKGAVFCNLFLADEINRTSSRTQSALLEVMEENQITVDGVTFQAYDPFNVIATQNPFGSAGTQLLPESQLDRFMICLSLGYPSAESEVEILRRKQHPENYQISQVVTADELREMQKEVDQIFVHDEIMKYAVQLVYMTRSHSQLSMGASPRGSICLIQMGKANAYLHDRNYVIPKDIQEVLFDVLGHRILLASARQSKENDLKRQILQEVLNSVQQPSLSEKNAG